MRTVQIVLFCAAALVGSAGLSALLFPYAALSEEAASAAVTPQPMESFGVVDLGPEYGLVPVIELMGYFLENPPEAGALPERPRTQFGGC